MDIEPILNLLFENGFKHANVSYAGSVWTYVSVLFNKESYYISVQDKDNNIVKVVDGLKAIEIKFALGESGLLRCITLTLPADKKPVPEVFSVFLDDRPLTCPAMVDCLLDHAREAKKENVGFDSYLDTICQFVFDLAWVDRDMKFSDKDVSDFLILIQRCWLDKEDQPIETTWTLEQLIDRLK